MEETRVRVRKGVYSREDTNPPMQQRMEDDSMSAPVPDITPRCKTITTMMTTPRVKPLW
jgi:hypothetical protein